MRPLFTWHRYMGLALAPFIVLMLLTAFVLNHSDELELAKKHVTSKNILSWYGIKEPQTIKGYEVDGRWIFQAGNDIYLDTKRLALGIKELRSALYLNNIIFLIDRESLLLITSEGELIEKLGEAHGLPPYMENIGLTEDDLIVIQGATGSFRSDLNLLNWESAPEESVKWAFPKALPEKTNTYILHKYRGKGPTYERFLLDLHSGRFMGKYGIIIMDTFAALFLMLSLFGIWMWAWGKKRS